MSCNYMSRKFLCVVALIASATVAAGAASAQTLATQIGIDSGQIAGKCHPQHGGPRLPRHPVRGGTDRRVALEATADSHAMAGCAAGNLLRRAVHAAVPIEDLRLL